MLRYISAKFGSAVKAYGVKQEFILPYTRAERYVESFHKSLKKEYICPYNLKSF